MKINIDALAEHVGTSYPAPHDGPCQARVRKRLGDAAGLSQFGVNLLRLEPGVWSSQRHWHTAEDEFVMVLEGELVMVTDAGEQVLRAGDCAGFKAGVANGHHLQNRTSNAAVLLEVGTRNEADACDYPDLDMKIDAGAESYVHKDGTTY